MEEGKEKGEGKREGGRGGEKDEGRMRGREGRRKREGITANTSVC